VNKRWTIGLTATLLAAMVSLVAAGPSLRHGSERHSAQPRLAANAHIGVGNPVMLQIFTSPLSADPRIIHVPQPDRRGAASRGNDREAALPGDEEASPQPRTMRRPSQYSGPPPSQQLTPIYPTPKFDVQGKASEKFAAPDEAAMPPSGTRRQN
jgi:hypothetical protein